MFKVMYEAYNNVLFTPNVSLDSLVDSPVLITSFTVADPGFTRREVGMRGCAGCANLWVWGNNLLFCNIFA